MTKYFILFAFVLCLIPQAHATACTSNAYGNITCVNQFIIAGAFSCATQQPAAGLSVTVGNRIVIWVDNTATITGLTDNAAGGSNTYTSLLGVTSWLGGSVFDAVFTAVAKATETLKFTPTCSGTAEMAGFQLHSSAGTVGIGCNSSSPAFVETASGTTATSTCTSSTSGLAFGFTDWNNTQPTADTGNGWIAVNDTAGEVSFQLKNSQTTATCIWHEASNDDFLSGCVVFTDGGATGPPANQYPRVQ